MQEWLYEHRQWSWLTLAGGTAGWALAVGQVVHSSYDGPWAEWHGAVLALVSAIYLATVTMFGCMRIQLSRSELRWSLGLWGWPRWRLPLADIVQAEPVRTRLRDGWGIRWSPRGWRYSVAGFDALSLTRRNGKRCLLGTNDLPSLHSALRSRLPAAAGH